MKLLLNFLVLAGMTALTAAATWGDRALECPAVTMIDHGAVVVVLFGGLGLIALQYKDLPFGGG